MLVWYVTGSLVWKGSHPSGRECWSQDLPYWASMPWGTNLGSFWALRVFGLTLIPIFPWSSYGMRGVAGRSSGLPVPVCTLLSGCWCHYKKPPIWLYPPRFFPLSIPKRHLWQWWLPELLPRLYLILPAHDLTLIFIGVEWVPSKLRHWMHYLDEGTAPFHEYEDHGWCLSYVRVFDNCVGIFLPLKLFKINVVSTPHLRFLISLVKLLLCVAAGAVGEKVRILPPLVVLLVPMLQLSPLVFLLVDLLW